jgi:hypothetical protein
MNRARAAVVVVLAVLLLAGCSEIPTTGRVQNGSTEGPNDTSIVYIANPPAAGASPREIVTGFLAAASAGGDLRVAKQYLSSGFVRRWDPTKRVLVQEASPRVTSTSSTGLSLEVPISGRVNQQGRYTTASGSEPLGFRLVQQGGQWRIDDAPDGIVLGPTVFQKNYKPQSLEFFDPTWTRLVPDVRWFPVEADKNFGAPRPRSVVEALVAGPAGPLAGGIAANALSGASVLSVDPGGSGVTTVAVRMAAGDPGPEVLARMQQQLIQSLLLPTPSALRLIVGGRVAPQVKQVVNQPGSLDAYVVSKGRFGTLGSNGAFTEEPVLGKRIAALDPAQVTVSVRQKLAAVLTRSQQVVMVSASGTPRVVDRRPGLVAPTLDQRGWVYSIPSGAPDGLQAIDAKGRAIDLVSDIAGPEATVIGIEVSPDGTRMLVLLNSATGPEAFVAGIARNPDGTPIGLTPARYDVALGGGGTGVDATWVDDGSVAVLASVPDNSTDRVSVQQLGGVALPLGQITNATSIVGTSDQQNLRVRLQSGALWIWTSNLWQPESSDPVDVSVLAVQR